MTNIDKSTGNSFVVPKCSDSELKELLMDKKRSLCLNRAMSAMIDTKKSSAQKAIKKDVARIMTAVNLRRLSYVK